MIQNLKGYKKIFTLIFSILVISAISLFRDKTIYFPKPYAYRFIELPDNSYLAFPFKGFPYSFDMSKIGVPKKIELSVLEKFCMNIEYPLFNAILQITYKNFNKIEELKKYIKTSKSLAYYHRVKSDKIKEELVETKNGRKFILIIIHGESPTKLQFFTTDGKQNFIRGAVYFLKNTNDEYLEPIINFLKKDINKIIETLSWNEE